MWKRIDGYFWQYRINEHAEIDRLTDSGKWKRVKPISTFYHNPNYPRFIVRMKGIDGKFKNVLVKKLVRDAFFPDLPGHMRLGHRNGMVTDCSVENLYPLTRKQCGEKGGGGNRRAVEKIDRDGNVVEVYSSTVEAAKKNYISRKSIWTRCTKRLENPYSLDGYTYRYAK